MVVKNRRISVVGVGPGHPSYLTSIGMARIESASLLVGTSRLLELFPTFKGKRVSLSNGIEYALSAIRSGLPHPIAVLVTGDTGVMSLASVVISRFGLEACEVIPGVSAVQVAFARVGFCWHDARIIDAHGRTPCVGPETFHSEQKIAVMTGCGEAKAWLMTLGKLLGRTHKIMAFQDLTMAGEKIWIPSEAELASLAGAPRTIILFLRKELCQ